MRSDGLSRRHFLIGTGGLVDVVANQTTVFSAIDRDLTLQGLRLLGELNP